MDNTLKKDLIILSSRCDSTARLGIPDTFALVMDLAAEHAEALGNGVHDMAARDLFWLVVKTRLRFYRRPALMERVTAATWPEEPSRVGCTRDYLLTRDGEALVAGKTEWAILNTKSGALRSGKEGIYAPELVFSEARALPEPFHRFKAGGADWEPFGAYTVRSTDIDLGGHMNNAAYIRALAGLFSTGEWDAMAPSLVEAHYRSSCYEGDTLTLVRRQTPAGLELRADAPDGSGGSRTVLYALIA